MFYNQPNSNDEMISFIIYLLVRFNEQNTGKVGQSLLKMVITRVSLQLTISITSELFRNYFFTIECVNVTNKAYQMKFLVFFTYDYSRTSLS